MRLRTVVSALGLVLALLFSSGVARAQYQITNLESNQEKAAKFIDPLIVNAWGLAAAPQGPWWVSDNASGWSTLYASTGAKIPLNVSIPTAGGDGPGTPTGIVFNGSSDFKIQGAPAVFIFATLDGTISGWAPSVNPDSAIIAATSPSAVYTGLTGSTKSSGNFLFAADTVGNKIDIYDANFKFVSSFTDPSVPSGFTVYGIQDFGGLIYVSFASTTNGPGGYIDLFDETGTLIKQITHGGALNQPWGFAIAPNDFGPLSNALLISNNSDAGTINGFNPVTGQFIGTLKDSSGAHLHINLLWGLAFGNGVAGVNGDTNQLFFTAGSDNYGTGTFGVIVFHP
jgi:uncharacterized protein (TIGR03118 family)